MTLRKLLLKAIEFCSLDQPVYVRVLIRNEHGSVIAYRCVEIAKWSEHSGEGACIDIEKEALDHAPLKRG